MDFVSCGELVMAKDILGLDIAEADVLFKAMEDPEILKKVRERQFRQALLLMEGPMRGPDGVLAKLAEARHDAEQLVAKGHHFPLEIQ